MLDTLHIILPCLFQRHHTEGKDRHTLFPHIYKALIKSTAITGKPASLEGVIKSHFSGLSSGEIPAGALGALAHGLTSNDARRLWIRADPVSYKVDMHGIYCLGNMHLDLSQDEMQNLEESFNAHFSDQGILLKAVSPKEWYLSVDKDADISTNALADVEGKPILTLLPSGPDQALWHKRLTESQMLFKKHPVNIAREKRRLPTVDGVWFWGVGRLPKDSTTYLDIVVSNSSPIDGLVRHSGKETYTRYPSYADFEKKSTSKAKYAGLIDTRLKRANNFRNETLRNQLLSQYDQQWFKPVLQALAHGHIKSLIIDGCDGKRFFVTKRHLKYFWRRQPQFEGV